MYSLLAITLLAISPTFPVRATLAASPHDGDTIVATIHLPFAVDLPRRTIRAAGYDAWEVTRTRRSVRVTDGEIAKGKVARDALAALIASGELYLEDEQQRDPYGRVNARLWVKSGGKWTDVAEWMKAAGHCRNNNAEELK